jgi:hypothetical protein
MFSARIDMFAKGDVTSDEVLPGDMAMPSTPPTICITDVARVGDARDRVGCARDRSETQVVGLLAAALVIAHIVTGPSAASLAHAGDSAAPAGSTVPTDSTVPLHERIDAAIRAKIDTPVAESADDAEFVRRLYLDLAGRIPSADEARRYFADPVSDKRARLIDRLLDSNDYARHMQTVFDSMLMERRADKHIPSPQWQAFLVESFRQNKPYHQLVREILSSDGSDADSRAAAKFYLDREADANLLTRDIGRLFLGMDLQCAQCHDHPLIDDYLQGDYYGIYAFVSRSYVFTTKKDKTVTLAEKGEGEVSFTSVFTEESGTTTPRLPDGEPTEEPAFEKGKEYVVAPADGVRPEPKYSRRARLPELIASGDDTRFRRNIVNRLWGMMMGRGLVHPYDLDHSDNPPSHPELLDTLADEFAVTNFDIKRFLRELALSETYQRSSMLPETVAADELPPEQLYAVAILRPLSPEQFAASLMQATGAIVGQQRAAESAATTSDPRMHDLLDSDDQWRRRADTRHNDQLHDRTRGQVKDFSKRFGGQPGTTPSDFESTVHQALYMANGTRVLGWLKPSSGNLLDRLSKERDPSRIADDLYLSVFARLPSGDERREVCEIFAASTTDSTTESAAESATRLEQLAWALLASAEFRLNH